jgi:hypothetical protein
VFRENSRYAGIRQVTACSRDGREVNAVALRRLPAATGERHVVAGNDRLDVIAQRQYGDATRFWHIADANSEMEARSLLTMPNRVIQVPEQ